MTKAKKVLKFLIGSTFVGTSAYAVVFWIEILVLMLTHKIPFSVTPLIFWLLIAISGLIIAWLNVPSPRLNAMPYYLLGIISLIMGVFGENLASICSGAITIAFGIIVRNFVWDASKYPVELNTQWAKLRAIEWIGWPLFVTQPLVPMMLYFYPWYWIVISLISITFLWRIFLAPNFVSVNIVAFGAMFTWFKFLSSPVICYLLWKRGDAALSLLALLWPLVGIIIANLVFAFLHAFTGTIQAMHSDAVEADILNKLG